MSRHSWSLRDADRNAYGERVTRQPFSPSLSAGIDKIFRDAEQAARQQPGKGTTMTATGALEGLHTPRDTRNRIAQLAADGVTQLSGQDLKGMRPEQIEAARREGRLLQLMSGEDS